MFDFIYYFSDIDIIINTAAYLPADKCEQNIKASYNTNVEGVKNIIEAIKKLTPKTIFIHFSTDFVFDGKKGDYSEDDIPNPLNIYGWHKLIADNIIQSSLERFYIFRIASLIAYGSNKYGFLQKVINNINKKTKEINTVSDLIISISTPEWIYEVLKKFLYYQPEFGIYNVVAKGKTSWYAVVKKSFEWLNIPVKVNPISYRDYTFIAKRPINSSLSINKLSNIIKNVKTWEEILFEHINKFKYEYKRFYNNLYEN